ncbi:MAG: hypothetical protein INR62_04800 [Rhodospirillales bacterium]|nr:hypothetical protein [Acetobacter sp.]
MFPAQNVPVTAGERLDTSLPLWRLYTLRACYALLFFGLAFAVWPAVLHHTDSFATRRGAQFSLLAGLGLIAALGLRWPVRMLPLLLFEMTWKAIYLVAFAWPLWRHHAIDAATATDIASVATVLLFVPLLPWKHIWSRYAAAPGEPWR